jgi:hypothetical protein
MKTTNSFAITLRNQIRNELNECADALAAGPVADWTEFSRLRGVIQGLALAERYLIDLAEKQDAGESNGG